jgi:hypothetical protein
MEKNVVINVAGSQKVDNRKKALNVFKNLIHISKKLVFGGKIFGFEVVCAILQWN